MSEKKIATIYDYQRMCLASHCNICPLSDNMNSCSIGNCAGVFDDVDKVNDIIVKWCEEHPTKTRQSEFLKMFPETQVSQGVIDICPKLIDYSYQNKCNSRLEIYCSDCDKCKREFWSQEVE